MEFIKPEIFQYLDYRKFLRDSLDFLARKDRKFSQRWLAQKAGWKSPQLLTMILKGQRKLSVEQAQLLSLGLKLSEKEEEYLLVLVELENAEHQEKQLEILDRIRFQFQNGFFKDLPIEGYEYLKKWQYPVVREICALKDFRVNEKIISRALDIPETESSEILTSLLAIGFLKKEGDFFLRKDAESLKASDYVSPMIMLQYHLQILERAFHAVQLNRELRHFESLVVALPLKDMEKFREKIRQFVREIDMMCESSAKKDDVFQLSIQFFSLTGGRLRKSL